MLLKEVAAIEERQKIAAEEAHKNEFPFQYREAGKIDDESTQNATVATKTQKTNRAIKIDLEDDEENPMSIARTLFHAMVHSASPNESKDPRQPPPPSSLALRLALEPSAFMRFIAAMLDQGHGLVWNGRILDEHEEETTEIMTALWRVIGERRSSDSYVVTWPLFSHVCTDRSIDVYLSMTQYLSSLVGCLATHFDWTTWVYCHPIILSRSIPRWVGCVGLCRYIYIYIYIS
jgi:hypothetical protein